MKKISSIVVIAMLVMALSYWLFSGGGNKGAGTDTVILWHWMTDRDAALKVLARKYEEQTGVEVKIDLFAPSDVYSKKITASTQANILPDIFGVLDTKKTFSDFIRYGYVADLTAELNKDEGQWKSRFFEKALATNVFEDGNTYGIDPGIYGVPIDVTTIQMLYNKKLLKKAGHQSSPKTFDEFLKVSGDLKRVGIPPLVSGWGELWLIECFASNYAFNIMGEEKIMATYRGDVPYTDADWIEVFNIFKKLTDNGVFIAGIIAKPNKEAEQDFALERAAFAFNGSWSVNVYREMNPDLDYGVMLPPAVESPYPLKIWGGAGSSFVVNARSARKKEAVDFLKWLTDKAQQEYLAGQTNNLPGNREALTSIPEILEDFARDMDHVTHPNIWKFNEQPLVVERFAKGIQSIILGKKTSQEVAQEVQELKVREMEKVKRRNE